MAVRVAGTAGSAPADSTRAGGGRPQALGLFLMSSTSASTISRTSSWDPAQGWLRAEFAPSVQALPPRSRTRLPGPLLRSEASLTSKATRGFQFSFCFALVQSPCRKSCGAAGERADVVGDGRDPPAAVARGLRRAPPRSAPAVSQGGSRPLLCNPVSCESRVCSALPRSAGREDDSSPARRRLLQAHPRRRLTRRAKLGRGQTLLPHRPTPLPSLPARPRSPPPRPARLLSCPPHAPPPRSSRRAPLRSAGPTA